MQPPQQATRKRVSVVAGGAGFIGSHLCDYLLKRGDRVIALDNLCTGCADNLREASSSTDFKLVKADVVDKSSLDLLLGIRNSEDWWGSMNLKIDCVYHLASRASPVDFVDHALEILDSNSEGTKNLIQLALQHNARFLLASTSECYGSAAVVPQPETYWGCVNSIGVRSCYDEGKRFGEALTMAHVRNGLNGRIVRIFNTYGSRMRKTDGRVIPSFVSQAISSTPLTVHGSGMQTRSFCHVSDLVQGLYLAMNVGSSGEVINLGNPEEVTMMQVAQKVIDISHSASSLNYVALPQDDPPRRCPDISKAKRLLGWEPHVQLDEGLTSTIEWFFAH
ncbi:SDR family oxidoreductase [Pelomyxa schiedti]|nr:SDR family oxidoreductase [Pelomyxa schiedti]